MAFTAILWPTDGGKAALRALKTAVELAKTHEADLFALQIIRRVPQISQTDFASTSPTVFNVPLYEEHLLKDMKTSLQKIMAKHVPKKISVESVVQFGEPAAAIVDFARQKKIDLIVMATHGRTGMTHLFLGSVAEHVIRTSPVPVLVVPAPSKES